MVRLVRRRFWHSYSVSNAQAVGRFPALGQEQIDNFLCAVRVQMGVKVFSLLRVNEGGVPLPALSDSRRRGAHQVVKRAQRRLGTVAGRNNNLLERHRGGVPGGKHTGQVGLAARIHNDLTVF